METPQFMILVGSQLDTLTPEQAAQELAPELQKLGYITKKPDATTGPIKEPPVEVKPKQVAGYPRTQVGTRRDQDGSIHGIFIGTGMPGLLEVVSQPGEPDAYVDRAFNLIYDLLPGVARPTGPETFWGLNPVPGASRQPGYRVRYFPDDDRAYWELSDAADEEGPRKTDAAANDDDVTPEITGHYEPSGSKKQ